MLQILAMLGLLQGGNGDDSFNANARCHGMVTPKDFCTTFIKLLILFTVNVWAIFNIKHSPADFNHSRSSSGQCWACKKHKWQKRNFENCYSLLELTRVSRYLHCLHDLAGSSSLHEPVCGQRWRIWAAFCTLTARITVTNRPVKNRESFHNIWIRCLLMCAFSLLKACFLYKENDRVKIL